MTAAAPMRYLASSDCLNPHVQRLPPQTRGEHIVYALGAPVCLTNTAHRRPVNLLARIETELTKAFGGDPGFAGRITKNPFYTNHLPLWSEATDIYSLKDLAPKPSLPKDSSLPTTITKPLVSLG